jgi:hypothetical protein
MKKILIFFYLISITLSLRLDLTDDYYIKVYIGKSKKEYKLLVDLTYSLSYIVKPYTSQSKNETGTNIDIQNIYGNYTGKWIKDIFNFGDQNMEMEMRFVEVTKTYYNSLSNDVDGVLGLGAYIYNKPDDTSIFYNLKKADKFCLNNITIYDKINKRIMICDNYENNTKDDIYFPLRYNDVIINDNGVLNITRINVISNTKEKEKEKDVYTNKLTKKSFIGMIPTLIIPNEILNKLNLNGNKNESSYDIFIEDKNEIVYKNKNDKKSNISFIDMEKFEKYFDKNYVNNWYLGLNGDDIKRVYFDYDKREISICYKSYISYIIRIILFVLSLGFFLYAVFNVFMKKKEKNLKNDNGQEMMNLED